MGKTPPLESIQKHTERGHGLFTRTDESKPFPFGQFVGCLATGHMAHYAATCGLPFAEHAFKRKPSELAPDESRRMISLADLLRRVPELQHLCVEYLGANPLAFYVGKTSVSELESEFDKKGLSFAGVLFDPDTYQPLSRVTTHIAICPIGYEVSADEVNRYLSSTSSSSTRSFQDSRLSASPATL